ncbi:membrane protein [Streptomyces phage Patelgo]|nr:membrane protein [Streptomyces phage Patelgo]
MEEFLIYAGLSFALSALITPVANYGFHMHWNFFLVWLVMFFVVAFGEYILD